MTTFSELGLSKDALIAVEKLDYTEATPVQQKAIPEILAGADVIAAANTGTGKTAAFLLPTISKLKKVKRGRRAPRILVITPTRELAQQIAFSSYKICRACKQYTTVIYGGAPYNKQIRELREGTDVLIATPGRLVDLMDRRAVNLSKIEVLILDEADRMLDMGFLPDITKIIDAIPEKRQTLLFSATIDESITNNLGSLLVEPKIIQIAQKGETAKDIEQYIIPVANKEKPELLKSLLDEKGHDKVVVFARTKARAEDVCKMLKDADFDAVSIHSDKSQKERKDALNTFRKGHCGIIVATDVLARGIDVPLVDYVVNYDLPDMPEDYIHRIGRTGRAGERGFAVSFASPNSTKVLASIEALLNKTLPTMTLETYDVNERLLKRPKNNKAQAHSNERARKHRNSKYDYTGWGDLRRGAKKLKDMSAQEREAAEKQRAKRAKRGSQAKRKDHTDGDELLTKGDTRRGANRPGMKSSALRNPKKGSGKSGRNASMRGSYKKSGNTGGKQDGRGERGAGKRSGNYKGAQQGGASDRRKGRRGAARMK